MLLPEPERPTMANFWPRRTVNDTFESAGRALPLLDSYWNVTLLNYLWVVNM